MRICDKHGIPYGHYHGGPNVWTQFDRDAQTAFLMREALRCPNCREFSHQWRTEHGFPDPLKEVESFECVPCLLLADDQEAAKKSGGKLTAVTFRFGKMLPRLPRGTPEPDSE